MDRASNNPLSQRVFRWWPTSYGLLLLGFLVFVATPLSVCAAPFAQKFEFTQPDGVVIALWGEGDEFYAVFETMDGYTVTFDPVTKAYQYAAVSSDGTTLVPTALRVGRADPGAAGLSKHVRLKPEAIRTNARARQRVWDESMGVSARWNSIKAAWRQAAMDSKGDGVVKSPPGFTTTGLKVGLTLLIDFSDDVATIPQTNIVAYCNGTNYTGYGNNGSVMKYFYDNSNGLLTYTNVVTIYIRAPQLKSYYNDTSKDCGAQGRLLINDAISALKALPNYTTEILPAFNDLTVDGSSRVVACNVFFAGANSGVWSYGLWPHSWTLASAVDLGNGKKVYKYQITNIGTSLSLGTFCHENGHMLCGYPDIYDYDYDSVGGAGRFCLMNSGGSGSNPSQICAYLKRASGWATTVELTSASNLTASVSSSGTGFNKFYRYQKPGVSTEYYLVENRQKTGRDAGIPGGGIAIWHIDEYGDRDNQNTNYNTTHLNYEVSLMQADNLWHFQSDINSGDANDLYYLGNNAAGYGNTFTDISGPSARWWDGGNSGIRFGQFGAKGTTMTFFVGAPNTPLLTSDSCALTAETCLPTNNAADPGELVTMSFGILNTGGVSTTNLVATLLATNGVISPSGPQNYGVIATNSSVSRSFSFTANGACGDAIHPTFLLQDGATNYGNISFTVPLGAIIPVATQNFDGNTAPALPVGWTTSAGGGQAAWFTSTAQSDTSPNAAFSTDAGNVGSNELVSTSIAITTGSAQLSFRHSYDLESGYDGGVLEVKIGDGTWQDILAAGGSFVAGGYDSTLSASFSNPLGGRQAWSGNSSGFITTTVSLPAAAAGQNIQIRWRCGTDSSVSGAGWYIDTISISERSCCAALPTVSVTAPDASAKEWGADPGQFTLTRDGSLSSSLSVFVSIGGSASAGVDYSPALTSPIVISAGNSTTNIVVTPVLDALAEGSESVTMAIVSNAAYQVGALSNAAITIADRPVDQWRVTKFGPAANDPAISGDMADPDGDGLNNLIEYALNLEPLVANTGGLPAPVVDGDHLTLTFKRWREDVTYTPEVSGDPGSGWANAGVTEVDAGFGYVKAVDPESMASSTRRFIHLRVTRTP